MNLRLDGKAALVTGGSHGIGRATAALLAEEGCDVAIVARDREGLAAAAAEICARAGREVVQVSADLALAADVERAVAEAVGALGRIDVLVTCAGTSPPGLFEELDDESWETSLGLKFMGYVRTCRAVLPHMREQGSGSIVLVVGNAGQQPCYWELSAGAANAANLNVAAGLAEQYGPHGIRVNTVNPGPTATRRWEWVESALARDKGIERAEARQIAVESIPLGRFGEPEDIAAVVAFLASPLARYVNGAHVRVDGGQVKSLLNASHPSA